MADFDKFFTEGGGLQDSASGFTPRHHREQEGAGLSEDARTQNVTRSRVFVGIDGVDYSHRVDWTSLFYSQKKGGNRNPFSFNIKNPQGEIDGLSEVQIKYGEDFASAEVFFGGYVTKTERRYDGLLEILSVSGLDYSWRLDKKLVIGEFSGSVRDIIDSIMDFAPNEFEVKATDVIGEVDLVRFNYIPVSEALTEVCDMFMLEWYVDSQKKLNIVRGKDAPYTLEDEDDTYLWNTLRITDDYEQIKNSIVIRGGEFISNIESEESLDTQIDGENDVLLLGYRYRSPQVYIKAGTPQEQQLTLGLDNLDSFDNNDVLYNVQEKLLRFETPLNDTDKPVVFRGFRRLPIRIAISDDESIQDLNTEFEFLIVDRTIESQKMALDRARAELDKFSTAIADITFTTDKEFFEVGQIVRLKSQIRGIDEKFVITNISAIAINPFKLRFDITGMTVKKLNLIDVLKRLLLAQAKNITISPDEVLTLITEFKERIRFEEGAFTFNVDADYIWVAGPYTPIDGNDQNRSTRADTGAVVQS